ncbi:isochorismatase family protein [Pelagibacterium lacus]|uniref:Isochorismatase family protein n=1 Tax=Pelagibacterium lacus TaxID=2282655 RepID=A0A369W6X4_9HYPH|nr:isochorismatase family protein [Pelagibacterium lacus]RDE10073.1 isochorismatase family protein [Pelagibacterium lacus]
MSTPSYSDETDFFRQRGFGHRIGFGKTPALLVVDIVKAFTDPKRPLGSDLDAQVEAINALIDAAHAAGAPVIYSTVSYENKNLKDAGIWALKQSGTATLVADGDGPELDERLHWQDGDSLLVKKYASCFFGTDLVSRLLAYGADTLIVTGATTSGCVRASAVDACQTGFRPMVVREAVGDRSTQAHEQSLFDLDVKYADVVGLEETLAYLNGLENVR